MTSKIYEIRDASDDERYYSVGFFSSLEKAKAEITVENCQRLASTETPEGENIRFEVYEHELDIAQELSCRVLEEAFERVDYDEEKDKYSYKRVE